MKKEKFPIKREVSDEKGEVSDKKRGLLQSREVSEKKRDFRGNKEVSFEEKKRFEMEKKESLR